MDLLEKGQRVEVETLSGPVIRLVWEDLGWAIQVCSDTQYEAMQKGEPAPPIIGFRRKYVQPVFN